MPNGRLETWQEIASHLGKSVSTVQRWEKERGLPVHRLGGEGLEPGKKLSNVFAFAEELDSWLKRQLDLDGREGDFAAVGTEGKVLPTRAWIGKSWALAGVASIGAVVLTVLWTVLLRTEPNPVSIAIERGDGLVLFALDSSGGKLWSHSFSPDFVLTENDRVYPQTRVVDLDGDGRNEVVYLQHLDLTNSPLRNHFACFESDGRLRWTFTPEASPEWAGRRVSNSFTQFRKFVVGRMGGGRKFVALVANHSYAGASLVSILNSAGSPIGEYLHTGYVFDLTVADTDGDGVDEILLGGINNRYGNSPFLALIDPDVQSAISPSPVRFDPSRRSGQERFYVLAPRTDVADALHLVSRVWRVNAPQLDRCFAANVESEDNGEIEERVYTVDYELKAMNLVFAQDLVKLHRELESAGKLDHPWDEESEKARLMRLRRLVPPDAE